MQTQMSYNKI